MVFKKLTEKTRSEKGYCLLGERSYATIDGIRTHHTTQKKTSVKIHWICELREERPVFVLLNGVTGWESWSIQHLIDFGLFNDRELTYFLACAGTTGRWDKLILDREQVKKVVLELVSIYGLEIND
ncbi:hypothetical protein PCC7424_5419 (plasmid) [Gloeothece citriformis PCC 7424]|uniref:Uncharacterized protein n=1 Tax=Gloeothece citriformis (strain PCC 7424) TaxID=65393 RepID=B7KMH2_GLOC7|nr:hypothetical protein [Gloeothece citriformis]ACK73994.1 hypothetical protein PCC7424_5419 [Gloeothece citriformis PCC 7424]